MARTVSAAAAGSGLLLAVSGCGLLPGVGEDPLETIRSAVEQTREVENYRAELAMSGSVEGVQFDNTAELEYVAEPEATLRMVTEVPGAGTSVVLMRDDDLLVEGDPSTGQAEWLRMDLTEAGQEQQQITDPVAEVEQLLAGDEVEEAGSEEIDGTSTTRYTGSFPAEEALREIEDSEARETTRQMYESMGVSEIPFDIWISEDGLPRRVHSDVGDVGSTVDFLEFNTDVAIDYPDEDLIEDFDHSPAEPEGGEGGFGLDPEQMPEMDELPDLEDMEDLDIEDMMEEWEELLS